jgi:hypothetical protein
MSAVIIKGIVYGDTLDFEGTACGVLVTVTVMGEESKMLVPWSEWLPRFHELTKLKRESVGNSTAE